MKNNSPARKKVDKLSAEIQQLEAQIAEKKEKLASLKEAKLDAENTEIISLIRNADLSIDDIQELLSDLNAVKKAPSDMAKSQPMSEIKGDEKII